MKKSVVVGILLMVVGIIFVVPALFLYRHKIQNRLTVYPTYHPAVVASPATSSESENKTPPSRASIPSVKVLSTNYHIFQTFNNCGPASLSMALSYFGINKSQEELGQELRPYQVKNGDNDDKSVTLDELANKAQELGLVAYHRPNGNQSILKQLIANDLPVITVTWLKPNDDIGHYRVVKGYDDTQGVFIQDDSFQGKNLTYTYSDFNVIWEKFNFEYLVLAPSGKKELVEKILGDDVDERIAWGHAATLSQQTLEKNPADVYARFNLSVAYYHIGRFAESVKEYESVSSQLPFRTLWYQIEPILAYYELGNYDKVFQITDTVLNNHNRAFSELYLLRATIYEKQGKKELARQEYEKAVLYNKNLISAQKALSSLK